MNVKEFSRLTIRARAAFALLIAELLIANLDSDAEGYDAARKGLRVGAAWVAGGEVTGDQLSDTLLDPNDEGIYAYIDRRKPRETDCSYNVLGAAISYVAWKAYLTEKSTLPEGFESVTEDYIQWLVDEADKSALFNLDYINKVYDYLRDNFKAAKDNELGEPIEIYDLKKKIFPVA